MRALQNSEEYLKKVGTHGCASANILVIRHNFGRTNRASLQHKVLPPQGCSNIKFKL